MDLHGKNHIGYALSGAGEATLSAHLAATGASIAGGFYSATTEDVDKALRKSVEAFEVYKALSARVRADFLEAIAQEIEALGDDFVARVVEETGLPEARIQAERARTIGQLRLFVRELQAGHYVAAAIDTALPDRTPVPRPDLRRMLVPIGPVVVFTASNFPLAFSTAGGDTASALAAGNPVVVKAHESHLGTNAHIADAILRAAKKTQMPDGVFSSLQGAGHEIGQRLVQHPQVAAVAFTGSLAGGRALYDAAAQRPNPIPVFAEMGSLNPVLLLPHRLQEETDAIADQYATSIALGVGQFCTKPGLFIGLQSEALTRFEAALSAKLSACTLGPMLNQRLYTQYEARVRHMCATPDVQSLAQARTQTEPHVPHSALTTTNANTFIRFGHLSEEVFGPYALLVRCPDESAFASVLDALGGQLSCSIIGNEADISAHRSLISKAQAIAGRLIYNGVPTGVEVSHAMQHGGPYPATTDSRFTSVGASAIQRFLRPICIQNAPQQQLPPELQDQNPLKIWRTLNGTLTQEPIVR